MEVEEAYNYLTEASTFSKLKSFMVFGGEPMLFPNRAISTFKKAQELGIPKIEMLTNGFWGRNRKEAEKLATKLKISGLNCLGISVDAFHQQHIPLEYPRNAAAAASFAGIEQVTWNVAVIESLNGKNKYDRKTAQILKMLESVGIEAHIHNVLPVGRAAKNLRRYFKREPLEGPCTSDPILGNDLTNIKCVTLEPSGEVDICWHLAIGNAKEKPLSQILRQYNWRENRIIRTLVEEGPTGLAKTVKRGKFQLRKRQFINKCHLCIELRKALH
jgi:MoaA/NifB/PqqE/SkfB family radical SAM enzyme